MNKQTLKIIKKYWENNNNGMTYPEYIKSIKKIVKNWKV